jgi:hypothetical protein
MVDPVVRDSQHDELKEPEGRVGWFFKHYWPLLFFGSLFVLMMVIPTVLSGFFASTDEHVFVPSYVLSPVYGSLIALAFLGAMALVFLRPSLLGLYLIFWGIIALVVANNFDAWFWSASIAVCFIGFAVLGTVFMFTKKWY